MGCALVALSDYTAVGASEVSLREGQHAELLKVGCAGWWYVRLAGAYYASLTPLEGELDDTWSYKMLAHLL